MTETAHMSYEPAHVATRTVFWWSLVLALLPALSVGLVALAFLAAGLPTAPASSDPASPTESYAARERHATTAPGQADDDPRLRRAMQAVVQRTDPYGPVAAPATAPSDATRQP